MGTENDGFTARTRTNDDRNRATQVTTANNMTMRQVYATHQVGEFRTDVERESLSWRGAAGEIAGQVEDWVEENYETLIESRVRAETWPPAAPAAPAPSAPDAGPAASPADASIEPGMTPAEVQALLGEPERKVTFGGRDLWTYGGMEVVFEDGAVSDVRF